MRILAVRGQNLASLAEPFAIDLTAEPLAGAGLFAITGETGAGKSTLLDAICLALYGEFPRLDADGGANEEVPDAGGDALKARDARSILRRGATSGSCEVDFIGVDGLPYRAHWAVYRARGRAGGRLQPASRHIERLGPDGVAIETIAEQIRAVDARIVELTDFTFEQFRRTVLLAQGDFDAFLRADDRERADLLEKITGTEIYARLSARAFEKAREAREAVALVEARRRDIGLLDPEMREERRQHRAALADRLAETRAATEAARADLARHQQIAAAEARLAEAEAETTNAEAARAAAAEIAERLDRIDRASALRPAFDRCGEAVAAESQAAKALAEVEAQLAATTPRIEAARQARDAARAGLAAQEARVAVMVPTWEAAAQLDTRIEDARREAADAEGPWQRALATRDGETARVAEVDARRLVVAGDLARIDLDLARLATLAPLADRWEDVEARLGERLAAGRDAARAGARREAAEATIAAAGGRLTALDATETKDAAARADLERRIGERRKALAAIDEAAVRARDAGLAALSGEIARLRPIAADRDAAATDAATARQAEVAARAEAEAAGAQRADIETRATAARARREDKRAAADLADAIASAEAAHLRAHLVAGEPCPVCGGRDHPIVADPAIRAAMERVRAERAALDAEIAELDRAVTTLDGVLAAAHARRGEAERRWSAAEARRARADGGLLDGLAEVAARAGSLALPFDLETATAAPDPSLIALAGDVEDARRATVTALDRAGTLRKEIDGLREALDRLDAARDLRRIARRDDEAALSAARAEAAAAGETEAGALVRRGDLDTRLGPLLAGLGIDLDDLDRDGEMLVTRLGRGVADRRGRLEAQARASGEEKDLERRRLALDELVKKAEHDLTAAAATLATRREVATRLSGERAGLLGGQATAVHRAGVEAERGAAAAALATAETALGEARTAHETALTLHGVRHSALVTAQDEVRARDHERDDALAAADLDLEAASNLLATPEDEIARLRAEIAGLDARVARARTAAEERGRDLAVALADGRPATAPADLDGKIAAARAASEAINREIGALDQTLAADDRARADAEGLEREIVAARARRDVAAAVDEAIGARDGDKFRRFAQGITLDRLTGLANRHLASLNPRYRLARAEGLGLTIVDRDMGDEVRSTRSLSGGERFLASLALALALSGLEGRRSFVDTLFIDEGFGSLDAATLDVAIDALEGLQSEGRKVGVISHVAAMHDRIPVQIRVEKAGAGRSRVSVTGGG